MEPVTLKYPQRNVFQFSENDTTVIFSSDFDSGNMTKVSRFGTNYYQMWTASDCQGMQVEGISKSWFYFSVEGFSQSKVTFVLNRIQVLWSLLRSPEKYRPVYKVEGGSWRRLPTSVRSIVTNRQNQIALTFQYVFSSQQSKVYFAFTYPYSYQQLQQDLNISQQKYQTRKQYYFKRDLLITSPQERNIDCVMISSHDGKDGYQNIQDQNILKNSKLVKFKNNKPLILITARVHPLETPSSFVMKGIIDFLTNLNDARSYILRKHFVFLLVPMLNPDGVARGHCRMDIFNQNLNRYYNTPDIQKQPSCYAIRKIVEHYNIDKRLFFYLDLHAHPANKGNFVFGNAIYDYIMQVESNVFPKLLSENSCNFQYEQCNFSRKHMTAKDRFQELNKQGCGRVVLYKQFNIIHAYTLECGYHSNTAQRLLQSVQNKHLKFYLKKKQISQNEMIYELKPLEKGIPDGQQNNDIIGLCEQELDDCESSHYKQSIAFYTDQVFKSLGKNILVTILDIWKKNPYPRVKDPNIFRKQIASQNRKLDRFRRQQTHLKTKQQNIVQLIQDQFYSTWRKKNVFSSRVKVTSTQHGKRSMTITKDFEMKSISQKEPRAQNQIKFKIQGEKNINLNNNEVLAEKEAKKFAYKEKESIGRAVIPQQFDDASLFVKYTYKFRISKKI